MPYEPYMVSYISATPKYINEPHIFGNEYVEHFYMETLIEPPQPHLSKLHNKFIDDNRRLFQGPVEIKPLTRIHNNALDAIGNFLLGNKK